MMEERDLGQESGRVVAGILGLFLVGAMVLSRFAISPILTFFKKVGMRGNGVHREIYADTPQFPLDFAYAYTIIYACKRNHRKRAVPAPKSSPRSPRSRPPSRARSRPTGAPGRTGRPPSTTTSSTRAEERTTRSPFPWTRSPSSRPPSPRAGSSGTSSSSFRSPTRTRSHRPNPR